MLSTIEHRGPDDAGMWMDAQRGIALGHRRLSILDLSPAGRQPMVSASGRFIIAFNGEVYNHSYLRTSLAKEGQMPGTGWRGHSDTETLLACIEAWGIERTLRAAVGMFALALWDKGDRALTLARDRFGEKPLYYGLHQEAFVFGSELKALVAHPTFERKIDAQAVANLLKYGYIPAPRSIYTNTFKLPAGCMLTLRYAGREDSTRRADRYFQEIRPYWTQAEVAKNGHDHPYMGSFDDASRDLETLLSDAVRLQMQADVPLGAFLSGGIDSSTVVALMQAQSVRPVKTFAVGFHDALLNEAEHAKAVAEHLGTDHTELYVSSKDALDVIPLLPRIYDEPFADSSQIPTFCVARLARRHVTVSLSGDGGDEIFGGYPRYAFGQRIAGLPFRRAFGLATGVLPWGTIESIGSALGPKMRRRLTASRFETLHSLLTAQGPADISDIVSSVNRYPWRMMAANAQDHARDLAIPDPSLFSLDYRRLAMVADQQRYLPDDILVKVDRATMAVSLESRAPLLDHRISEFAARLPMDYLMRGKEGKRILRDVLYRHVPQTLVDRPKAGFSVPLGRWLREDLREWGFDLLASDAQSADGPLDLERARALMIEHVRGEKDRSAQLWPILMFRAWQKA